MAANFLVTYSLKDIKEFERSRALDGSGSCLLTEKTEVQYINPQTVFKSEKKI